eukprot:TRINITY_DN19508_c0_g1_i1.p1 TRINITY_DN19508_c0_g1~~TRINITY_DN19508_c0_g1_i1.p1  ORF type:complete len:1934 (+),score=496.34 TRINITY_DN19508_c0_g1_i1:54-5804(+)
MEVDDATPSPGLHEQYANGRFGTAAGSDSTDPKTEYHLLCGMTAQHEEAGNTLQALSVREQGLLCANRAFGEDSLEVRRGCESFIIRCNQVAMATLSDGQFDTAFELLRKAEILSDHSGVLKNDPEPRLRCRAVTLNNFGLFYRHRGQNHAALEYLEQALEIEQTDRNRNSENPAATLLNLCAVLSSMGKYQPALSYAKQALAWLGKHSDRVASATAPSHPEMLAVAHHAAGCQYEGLREHIRAAEHFSSAVVASRALGEPNAVYQRAFLHALQKARASGKVPEAHLPRIPPDTRPLSARRPSSKAASSRPPSARPARPSSGGVSRPGTAARAQSSAASCLQGAYPVAMSHAKADAAAPDKQYAPHPPADRPATSVGGTAAAAAGDAAGATRKRPNTAGTRRAHGTQHGGGGPHTSALPPWNDSTGTKDKGPMKRPRPPSAPSSGRMWAARQAYHLVYKPPASLSSNLSAKNKEAFNELEALSRDNIIKLGLAADTPPNEMEEAVGGEGESAPPTVPGGHAAQQGQEGVSDTADLCRKDREGKRPAVSSPQKATKASPERVRQQQQQRAAQSPRSPTRTLRYGAADTPGVSLSRRSSRSPPRDAAARGDASPRAASPRRGHESPRGRGGLRGRTSRSPSTTSPRSARDVNATAVASEDQSVLLMATAQPGDMILPTQHVPDPMEPIPETAGDSRSGTPTILSMGSPGEPAVVPTVEPPSPGRYLADSPVPMFVEENGEHDVMGMSGLQMSTDMSFSTPAIPGFGKDAARVSPVALPSRHATPQSQQLPVPEGGGDPWTPPQQHGDGVVAVVDPRAAYERQELMVKLLSIGTKLNQLHDEVLASAETGGRRLRVEREKERQRRDSAARTVQRVVRGHLGRLYRAHVYESRRVEMEARAREREEYARRQRLHGLWKRAFHSVAAALRLLHFHGVRKAARRAAASVLIQTFARTTQAQLACRKLYRQHLVRAVCKCQSIWRGYGARLVFKKLLAEWREKQKIRRFSSAARIQIWWRRTLYYRQKESEFQQQWADLARDRKPEYAAGRIKLWYKWLRFERVFVAEVLKISFERRRSIQLEEEAQQLKELQLASALRVQQAFRNYVARRQLGWLRRTDLERKIAYLEHAMDDHAARVLQAFARVVHAVRDMRRRRAEVAEFAVLLAWKQQQDTQRAVEAESMKILDRASVQVQRVWRGYILRKRAWERKVQALLDWENAHAPHVTTISRMWRGFACRRRTSVDMAVFRERRWAAKAIQRAWRVYVACVALTARAAAATEAHTARAARERVHDAAAQVQAFAAARVWKVYTQNVRMNQAVQAQRRREAVLVIGRAWRCAVARRAYQRRKLSHADAQRELVHQHMATCIQRGFRTYVQRRREAAAHAALHAHAVIIQAHARARSAAARTACLGLARAGAVLNVCAAAKACEQLVRRRRAARARGAAVVIQEFARGVLSVRLVARGRAARMVQVFARTKLSTARFDRYHAAVRQDALLLFSDRLLRYDTLAAAERTQREKLARVHIEYQSRLRDVQRLIEDVWSDRRRHLAAADRGRQWTRSNAAKVVQAFARACLAQRECEGRGGAVQNDAAASPSVLSGDSTVNAPSALTYLLDALGTDGTAQTASLTLASLVGSGSDPPPNDAAAALEFEERMAREDVAEAFFGREWEKDLARAVAASFPAEFVARVQNVFPPSVWVDESERQDFALPSGPVKPKKKAKQAVDRAQRTAASDADSARRTPLGLLASVGSCSVLKLMIRMDEGTAAVEAVWGRRFRDVALYRMARRAKARSDIHDEQLVRTHEAAVVIQAAVRRMMARARYTELLRRQQASRRIYWSMQMMACVARLRVQRAQRMAGYDEVRQHEAAVVIQTMYRCRKGRARVRQLLRDEDDEIRRTLEHEAALLIQAAFRRRKRARANSEA